jgi:peptidoglycan/LPS O-acetylase OafA/YrhL
MHARLGVLPGGFVGVDVFFVISGYLIASIILDEIRNGTFNLASFYERRIRRIFPALFVVMLATLAAGASLLMPEEFIALGRSAVATIAFYSNLYFAARVDYFAPAAETQPLLHTWSLGVEEQFYLVAPFLLVFLARRSAKFTRCTMLILFSASLALATYGVFKDAGWAFYSPATRAFELLCGVAVAMGLTRAPQTVAYREIGALIGLGLILWAILMFDDGTPFPGLTALVPTVGTALVIQCGIGHATMTSRLLSLPPMVWTGKISYSLYLWHWPLLVYSTYYFGPDTPPWHRLAVLAAAVALATITYFAVEQPARRNKTLLTRRTVFAAGAAAMLTIVSVGRSIVTNEGYPQRLPTNVQALVVDTQVEVDDGDLCGPDDVGKARREAGECIVGDTAAKAPSFILWGDSHSLAVSPLVAQLAKEANVKGYHVGRGGCPPLFGLENFGQPFDICRAAPKAVERIANDPAIRDVILAARWGFYTEAERMPHETGAQTRPFAPGDPAKNREIFTRVLIETVERLTANGKRVTIIGPVPEQLINVPSELFRRAMRGEAAEISISRTAFEQRQRALFEAFREVRRLKGVRIFLPHERLCDAVRCSGLDANGKALYVDDDHLSRVGVGAIAPVLSELFASDTHEAAGRPPT